MYIYIYIERCCPMTPVDLASFTWAARLGRLPGPPGPLGPPEPLACVARGGRRGRLGRRSRPKRSPDWLRDTVFDGLGEIWGRFPR